MGAVVAMKIGEFAERAGTSVKTIRYYDRIGVLVPSERSESGYRLYSDDALDRYRFVRAAQAVGLRLGEVRQIIGMRDLGETPCDFVVELIGRRATELDERIAALEVLRDELRGLARRAKQLDARSCDPRLICHVVV
jgi:MerR family Zn(II)-responsive transcriptional regulator of zntA